MTCCMPPMVCSNSSSSSSRINGKLCHTDRPAAEKLHGLRPTVLVLGVAKSSALADCRCRRVAIAITAVSSDVRYTGASWCRHL